MNFHPGNQHKRIYIYGPPGSGKTTIGKELAVSLNREFIDLDEAIVQKVGKTIPEIFAEEGEPGFRSVEKKALEDLRNNWFGVIALGGGALLNEENRHLVESSGVVVCLNAPLEVIAQRISAEVNLRPLLAGGKEERLNDLIERRKSHYASFEHHFDTSSSELDDIVWEIQTQLGLFRVTGMGNGYDVFVHSGSLDRIATDFENNQFQGPIALVSDSNVGALYSKHVIGQLEQEGYKVQSIILPAGEQYKTIENVITLWNEYLDAGLERRSTIIALGGGVIGDLAGFSAATYLRGIRWVCVPTSLLAMCDASIGGKTGADLPRGKNLVGAFHPPSYVLADPQVLKTLPPEEFRSGLAEVVKHGILADPDLFEICEGGIDHIQCHIEEVVKRAIVVKIQVIQQDPYEGGVRATLNLGHTLGHALEKASGYRIRHGEAVAIGTVAAAALSERMGIAQKGIQLRIVKTLSNLGLPTEMPGGLDREALLAAMVVDKKKTHGQVRLVLPVKIGEVISGITVDRITDLLDVIDTD